MPAPHLSSTLLREGFERHSAATTDGISTCGTARILERGFFYGIIDRILPSQCFRGPDRIAAPSANFLASGQPAGEAIERHSRAACSCLQLFCSPRRRENPYNLEFDVAPGYFARGSGGSIQQDE